MWNPVDSIVVTAGQVPLSDDLIMPRTIIGDTGYSTQTSQSSNQTLKILAEFVVTPNKGQEYRNEIIYDPRVRASVDMKSASDFKQFDYAIFLRLKQSQALRLLSISNGGNVNMRYFFERK